MPRASDLDLVYDRLIASEKLKRGTKYERLAAIVFASLDGRTTIHDLRLRGSSSVRHQIDVTVGDAKRQLLVECKQYEKKIGLPIVRDFFAVVEDVRPAEAWVVTSVGFTGPAVTYAKSKGIKLAVLRAVQEEDLKGRITRIGITLIPTHAQLTETRWLVDPEDVSSVKAAEEGKSGRISTYEAALIAPDGTRTDLETFLTRDLDLRDAYEGDPGPKLGEHRFDAPHVLELPDGSQTRVIGLQWKAVLSRGKWSFDIGVGIGGLVAELALVNVDGDVLSVLSNRQIEKFSFVGDGTVQRVDDSS